MTELRSDVVLSIGLLDALRMWKPEMPVSSTEGEQLMETQPLAVDTVKASMVLWEVLWPGTVDVMDHPDLGAERFRVRQVLDALISANVLRDVRDVQAEALREAATAIRPIFRREDWSDYAKGIARGADLLELRAQAIWEVRNER